MKLQKRVVLYEDVEVEADDVLGISEAAGILGMTIQGLGAAINRGQLTEIVDPDAVAPQGRRFVLRSEVEPLAERRQRAREKWEGTTDG